MTIFFVVDTVNIDMNWSKRLNQPVPSRYSLVIVLALSLLVLILGFIFVTQSPKENDKSQAQGTNYKQYQDLLSEGKIRPVGEILEIDLHYESTNAGAPLTISKLKKKKGFAPQSENGENTYNLILVDEVGSSLYTLPFSVPATYTEPPSPKGVQDRHGRVDLKSVDFTLTTPYFPEADQVRLLDPQGRIILTAPLYNVSAVENSPNFRTIDGKDFQEKKSKGLINFNGFGVGKADAQTAAQYLDVVFIGDNYTSAEIGTFHTDVNRFISKLLEYEPFRSKSSQILFHYVDNTADLGCLHNATMDRLIVCNNSIVTQQVNNSAVPYDKIAVIVKDSVYGGSGGAISVAYNGSSGPLVFVHEFGHSFGGLHDEYNLYTTNGTVSNTTQMNCYAGTPPAAEWGGMIASTDYNLGCRFPNWYRSSANSMMLTLGPVFNVVSQKILNDKFALYTAPIAVPTPTSAPTIPPTKAPTPTNAPIATPTLSGPDTILPVVTITSPAGARVANNQTVSASATDNVRVVRMELYIDGALRSTSSTGLISFKWNTRNVAPGTHTILVKAFDAAGNIGQSSRSVTK